MRCRPRPSHMKTSSDSPIALILVICLLPLFNGGLAFLFTGFTIFGLVKLNKWTDKVREEFNYEK